VQYNDAPGDEAYTGNTLNATSGEAIANGDSVYLKSDGKIYKSNAATSTTMPVLGLVPTGAATAGAVLTMLINGLYRHDDLYNWTIGGLVYAAQTSGLLTQTQPAATDQVIQVVGIATHADKILISPQLMFFTHT
jgi:hypothetical protein